MTEQLKTVDFPADLQDHELLRQLGRQLNHLHQQPPINYVYTRMGSYYRLLFKCLTEGTYKPASRTATASFSLNHAVLRYTDFPIDHLRPVAVKGAVGEMLGFIKGATTLKEFEDLGCHFWKPWATEDGKLGPIYGAAWRRSVESVDQIASLIDNLKNRTFSRRHHVSAWNVATLPIESVSPQENAAAGRMALAPCHMDFTFNPRYVSLMNGEPLVRTTEQAKNSFIALDLAVHMRSNDLPVGQPHNAIGYWALLRMVCQVCGFHVGHLTFYLDDPHIYVDQIEPLMKYMQRMYDALTGRHYEIHGQHSFLHLNKEVTDVDSFTPDDFVLLDYNPIQPGIKFPVAV